MELKIRKDFEELQPRMTDDEFEALKNSIKERGYDKAFPIIVDENDTILDGHHRYRASKELNVEPVVLKRTDFADDFEKKEFIWLCSLRRNLSPWQKVEQAKKWEALQREKAKERKLAGRPSNQLVLWSEKGKTIEILAKKVGIGAGTLQRGFKVLEEGSEKLIEKLREGKVSILEAYEQIRLLEEIPEAEKKEELARKLDEEEITSKDLRKIVVGTQAVLGLLETIPQEGKKEILKEIEDTLWTSEVDVPKAKELIKAKYGLQVQVEVILEGEKFKNIEEAKNWASKYAGTFKKLLWVFDFPQQTALKAKEEGEKR